MFQSRGGTGGGIEGQAHVVDTEVKQGARVEPVTKAKLQTRGSWRSREPGRR